MAPILHLVRHAQGLHNVPPYDDDLIDPALTAVGEAQCNQLWKDFPFHSQLTHLAASPMQRALQTCIQSFGKDKLNTPVVALDMLQETSDAPNDTGSTVETLHTKFGDLVDLTSVSAEWMDKRKGGQFACEIDQVVHRASIARKMLHCLLKGSDGHIAAVSHGGFLHFLSDDWEGVSMQTTIGSTWANCEYRSYCFISNGEDISLRETDESWQRRNGHRQRPSEDMKAKWRQEALQQIAPHMRYHQPQ